MKPYLSAPEFDLWHGDCIEVIRGLPADSVDSVVTDPPYELGFMGKGWDNSGIAYRVEVWAEALRVLKPGGHLLAFGGTRTAHRLACAIEDAGFEIRDSIAWMYGSGFPKSLDVSKSIDRKRDDTQDTHCVVRWLEDRRQESGVTRAQVEHHFGTQNIGQSLFTITSGSSSRVAAWDQWLELKSLIGFGDEMDDEVWRLNGRKGQPGEAWAEREVLGEREVPVGHSFAGETYGGNSSMQTVDITAPATDAAQQWQGWGTALKPAHEPIVVARKPLIGTVAENVLRYGTGALNIDGCRVQGEPDRASGWSTSGSKAGPNDSMSGDNQEREPKPDNPAGRWPANVILDESQAAELDRQSGVMIGQVGMRQTVGKVTFTVGDKINAKKHDHGSFDFGGASRFFYTSKANSAERPRVDDVAHPTVKPLDLMRYLVRLVTPPGGVVLEPFAGSGTTIEASVIEGFRCIAIELTEEYLTLIAQRLTKPIQVTLL